MACPSILNITINWIDLLPFLFFSLEHKNITGYLPSYMLFASYKCGCPMMRFNYQRMNISSSEEMEIKIRSSLRTTTPELYFPIFANRKESTQFQRPFLALFRSPGPAVIRFEFDSWSEKMSSINIVMQTWPKLSVCLLFGLLAGFIVWTIERKKNPENFPAKFPHGALVGIWWSFVTMTTVGYGDKTTRTFWGRMFAVFWMILGTIVMSMFTGQITANITSSEIATVDSMDTKVGVPTGMKTFFEQEFNLGARYFDMNYSKMEEDAMLGNSNMEFYLLHDYQVAKQWLRSSKEVKIVKSVDHQFGIGMLVTGDFDPLTSMLTCIQREVTDFYQIEMANQKLQAHNSSFPPQESGIASQHVLLIATASLLVLLVVMGFLCEWLRKGKTARVSDVESQVPRPAFSTTIPSFFLSSQELRPINSNIKK